jgi:phage gp46-like protein
MKRLIVGLAAAGSLAGCMNMPTPTGQITGSYTSDLQYDTFGCERLNTELASLARRENQLVVAQDQRIKTSQMQAFWWGYGQGDGIEASELANVRGEKEAVRHAVEAKDCASEAVAKAVTKP